MSLCAHLFECGVGGCCWLLYGVILPHAFLCAHTTCILRMEWRDGRRHREEYPMVVAASYKELPINILCYILIQGVHLLLEKDLLNFIPTEFSIIISKNVDCARSNFSLLISQREEFDSTSPKSNLKLFIAI